MVFAGQWFYGKDMIIDVISVLVILFILIYSARFYGLNKKEKKYALLITSFSLLTLSFLAKILSHFIIYYQDTDVHRIGVITITYQTIDQSYALVFWGLLAYRILSILGIYAFYLIYSENTCDFRANCQKQFQSEKIGWLNILITTFLLVIAGYFGHREYAVYHITFSLILLAVIISLLMKYKTNKYHTTKLLIYGFALILISQIFFMLTLYSAENYMFGEIIQLAGYALVLASFIKVIYIGTKKKRTA